jgi:hypothetical protein
VDATVVVLTWFVVDAIVVVVTAADASAVDRDDMVEDNDTVEVTATVAA